METVTMTSHTYPPALQVDNQREVEQARAEAAAMAAAMKESEERVREMERTAQQKVNEAIEMQKAAGQKALDLQQAVAQQALESQKAAAANAQAMQQVMQQTMQQTMQQAMAAVLQAGQQTMKHQEQQESERRAVEQQRWQEVSNHQQKQLDAQQKMFETQRSDEAQRRCDEEQRWQTVRENEERRSREQHALMREEMALNHDFMREELALKHDLMREELALIREQQGAVPAIAYDSVHRGGFSVGRLVAPHASSSLALPASRSGPTSSVSAPVRFQPMKKKDPPSVSQVMSTRDPNTVLGQDGIAPAKELGVKQELGPVTPLHLGFAKKPQPGQSTRSWGVPEVAGWTDAQNFGRQSDEYAARMVAMGVEGPDLLALSQLEEDQGIQCLEEIGISKPLHRAKLLRSIRTLT